MMRPYLFIILSFFCFACNNNKAEQATPPAPQPQYYFFPKANVYFDSANKEYVFLGNDGTTWVTEKQIPAIVQSMMDKSVLIDSPATPVWRDNENHRLVYSALLYATPNDTVEKKDPGPAVQKPNNEVKKERKGFRKFVDKIFSRKKKDNKENEKKN